MRCLRACRREHARTLHRGVRCARMGDERIDFAAEGLLDGLEGAARADRLALLEQLADEGIPLSELRRTTATGTIVLLPADRVIGGRGLYPAGAGGEVDGGA